MDFEFTNHFSIWLCTPLNAAARAHLAAHLSPEAQWFAGGVAVEPRYVTTLVQRLQDDGFCVDGPEGGHN